MKVFGITDIHLDINGLGRNDMGQLLEKFNLPLLKENHKKDILLLAGDNFEVRSLRPYEFTGDNFLKTQTMEDLETICEAYKYVVTVFGNHEFYNHNYFQAKAEFQDLTRHIENLYFLDNNTVVLDGVKIIGTTLWTDLKKEDPLVMQTVKSGMNDYFLITYEMTEPKSLLEAHDPGFQTFRRLQPADTIAMFRKNHTWLKDQLCRINEGEKAIVMTHHAPIMAHAGGERYGYNRAMDYAYAATCMEQDVLNFGHRVHCWFHGHTHDRKRTDIGATEIVTYGRGYDNLPFDPIELLEA